jgi:hypothetical protein
VIAGGLGDRDLTWREYTTGGELQQPPVWRGERLVALPGAARPTSVGRRSRRPDVAVCLPTACWTNELVLLTVTCVKKRGTPMTESEWLTCTDPTPMLEFLRCKASERKLRLFAVACCRLVLRKVRVSPLAEREVDVAERYADGAASIEELGDARCYSNSDAEHACMNAAEIEGGGIMADCAAGNAAWAGAKHGAEPPHDNGLSLVFKARFAIEQGIQCNLLRGMIGNPFRPISIDPSWRAWNDGMIPELAKAIYDQRAFDRLPALADALEVAGCHDANILAHCRQPGPHVRGCWVVDLVLGKE